MGETVCTLFFNENESRDLVLPDHVPVYALAISIARSLGMNESEDHTYSLMIFEDDKFRRIPDARNLQQAYVLNGSILKLTKENDDKGLKGFLISSDGMKHKLRENTIIGRLTREIHVDLDLSSLDVKHVVSRRHAVITRVSQRYLIKDGKSRNGTYINNTRIPDGQSIALHSDDLLCFGTLEKGVVLKFVVSK